LIQIRSLAATGIASLIVVQFQLVRAHSVHFDPDSCIIMQDYSLNHIKATKGT